MRATEVIAALGDEAAAMTRLLAELVRVPSTGGSPAEGEIQHRLAEWMRAEGLEVDLWPVQVDALSAEPGFPGMEVPRPQAWGLVGRLPGTGGGRSLMFNGHVDVVPPGDLTAWSVEPYGGVVTDGLLYGRGACDMKGGLVAALFAVRAMRRARLRGDVLVACVPGEEDGGMGSYALLRRGWRADACVIPEPTGLDVVPANAGALTFRLRITGRAAHAARRDAGVSAVEKFWPVFAALRELEARRNTTVDPLMRRWNLPYAIEIGTVHAGDWSSSVPGELVAEGRLGVALDESPRDARAALEEAVGQACAGDDWLIGHPAEVEWWGGQYAAGRLPPDDGGLLERLTGAHTLVTGAPPGTWGAPYGSDLRLMSGLGGVPTVQYGPGDIGRAHGPDEFVPVAEVVTAARTLAALALAHCA
ncbi:acetylornithine deacetylase [Streptosporangium becharense]|uniref:Probable succinyl-diaminopimelate desuccinylase n=1 Tax=Streptosporangium becharense TaxID=1816182 RepID=A0A7W9MGZ8_9ACTN|nr:ArgE/DapE family deacylase [Streptosporangium becharense]MBB2912751.1 acetylornithine deacetylase [Streptosporangium becharense]MBB5820420.1 acetylornithine deacetylase [Streptosporangium becharense]